MDQKHIRQVVHGAGFRELDQVHAVSLLEHDEQISSEVAELIARQLIEWVVLLVPVEASTTNSTQPHVDRTVGAMEDRRKDLLYDAAASVNCELTQVRQPTSGHSSTQCCTLPRSEWHMMATRSRRQLGRHTSRGIE